MQPQLPPPEGIDIATSGTQIIITVEREAVSPLLSIMLNSKFGYQPRTEFLTNPYVNALIETLLNADQRARAAIESSGKEGQERGPELELAEQAIRQWAAKHGITGNEEAEMIELALFPWN